MRHHHHGGSGSCLVMLFLGPLWLVYAVCAGIADGLSRKR